jgi:hypothetical protein
LKPQALAENVCCPNNFIFIFSQRVFEAFFNSGKHLNSPAEITLELVAEKVQIFMLNFLLVYPILTIILMYV